MRTVNSQTHWFLDIFNIIHSVSHSVTRSLGHSVTRSLGHSVTRSLGHSVTRSLGHSVTRSLGPSVPRSLGPSVTRSLGHSVPRSVGPWVPRSGISFRFCATDLGSEKLTSVKKPSSVRVFTVGKLSSVGVQVTSSVLTEPGLRKPTSFCKPYRGCRYLTSVWCYYITVHGNTEYRNRVRFCF